MADQITAPQFSAIAADCLPALKSSTRWLRAAATNFTAEFGELNKTLLVLAAGTPEEAREFSHNEGYGQTDGKLLTTPVNLEKRFVSENTLDDAHFDSLNPSTLTELLKASVNSVAAKIEKFIAGKILASVVTNYLAVNPDEFSTSNLNAIRKKVVSMNLPAESVAAILNPILYTGLITDTRIAHSTVVDVARGALVKGEIDEIAGWKVYEASALPDNSENLCGMVLHPSAIAVAVRPVYTPGLTLFEVLSDDDTGFSISLKVVSDPMHARVSIIAETLVGASIVRPECILRLTEATE